MDIVKINKNYVKLILSRQRSKVRIADSNGNHISKPTLAEYIPSNYVEWMISNAEIQKLINYYLTAKDKKKLATRLGKVRAFLNRSKYTTRKAKKTTPLGRFRDFNIYKYEESFFSFERIINLNIKIRITFKMGDFTLAPHMFILFPFDKKVLRFFNCDGDISFKNKLGSGCYAVWRPSLDVICKTTEALAHASEGHKRDLLTLVK